MRQARVLLLIAPLMACAVFAQGPQVQSAQSGHSSNETWGGLRFGMTAAEATAAMKDRAEPTGNDPQVQYPAVYKITVGPATGTARLSYDVKTKALESVFLNFSRYERGDRRIDQAAAKLSPEEGNTRVAIYDYVSTQLISKYGRPANETGSCPTRSDLYAHYLSVELGEPVKNPNCERRWREQAQNVGMKFSVVGGALFLSVEYKSRSAASPL